MNGLNIVLALLLVAVLSYIIYVVVTSNITKEHFTTEEEGGYDARIETIKIFELVLNRKPTTEEIEKYSKFKNEQDILIQVLSDYKSIAPSSEKSSALATDTPKEAFTESITGDKKTNSDTEIVKNVVDLNMNMNVVPTVKDVRTVVQDLQSSLDELKRLVNISSVV